MQQLTSLIFQNDFVSTFPGNHSGDWQPRQTPGVLYCNAAPTPVARPTLIGWSEALAALLQIAKPQSQKETDILGGNLITPSMQPYAACYAGHQFGQWAGQLGDGRAITLGEIKVNGAPWELQLKGAGPTPYSRRADGRAVLRSSVREYLMSEAMFHLGVPTTRALSVVTTGDQVMRDMFYNGNAAFEPGAIVMRVAPSFLRFGNFEILAARGELPNLQQLTSWTIERYYPHINGEESEKILNWFNEVVERTASLMVEWTRVGFVHGVMNTDNMSILGLTIDYGPYSFIDDYDPNFTPNTTDLPGRRYAFGKQPSIAQWNLGCLAGALSPLLPDTEGLLDALRNFEPLFLKKYHEMMGNKLGLDLVKKEDEELISALEKMLTTLQPDMTIFYQLLMEFSNEEEGIKEDAVLNHFSDSFYHQPNAVQNQMLFRWMQQYRNRILKNSTPHPLNLERMRLANPRFILRNYLLHQAIEELEKGTDTLFLQLQQALQNPYSKSGDQFYAKRPSWASQKAGCSMLSCSS